jgi:Kef-type K+ transport system membrane component KefB
MRPVNRLTGSISRKCGHIHLLPAFTTRYGFIMTGSESDVLQALLTVSVLLSGAMIGGMLCRRIGVAAVVGELIAGVLLAPTLLGGIALLGLRPVVLNSGVLMLAQAGIILLIFLAGLETSFKKFIGSGALAALVATGGAVMSFVITYALCVLWGLGQKEVLIISAAATATSVSITFRTLKDLGVSQTDEGIILISAAVIDDVLGLITMAIVLGIVGTSRMDMVSVGVIAVKAIGVWLAMLIIGVFLLAKLIDLASPTLKHYASAIIAAFAVCFTFSWIAGQTGLSPIVGSFVAGMALAETRIRGLSTEMAGEMSAVLAVIFFAVTGAQASLNSVTFESLVFAFALVLACIAGKVLGCGLPVLIVRRSLKEAVIVGIGMVPRVEVGLIIASMGLAMGLLSKDSYSALIVMAIVTTVLTPLALKAAYRQFRQKPGPVPVGEHALH